MNNLCKYKDMFGKPREGSHKYRIFDIAIVDLIATAILAKIILYMIEKRKKISILQGKDEKTNSIALLLIIFVILIVLSIGIHKVFCVDTALLQKLKISVK